MENETFQNNEENNIASRITKSRMLVGLTQSDLSKKMQVSAATISNIENGKTEPSLGFISRFCRVLDIPSSYILTGQVDDSSSINKAEYIEHLNSIAEKYTKSQNELMETWKAVSQINNDYDIAKLFNSLNNEDKSEVIEFIKFKKSRYTKPLTPNEEFIRNFSNSISETIKQALFESNYQNINDCEK